MDHVQRKYHVINDQLILFNDEYYLTVLRVPIDAYDQEERSELFNLLYAFENKDIEVEIDVSEEQHGVWYLQLLVPYMLTLSEMAIRRIKSGAEALEAYMQQHGRHLTAEYLQGEQIYTYVKRYNPNLNVV
jgi:hypothetical protein